MKEYILHVTIHEGADEFWENLTDRVGCDDVLKEVRSCLFEAGLIDDLRQVRLLRFADKSQEVV